MNPRACTYTRLLALVALSLAACGTPSGTSDAAARDVVGSTDTVSDTGAQDAPSDVAQDTVVPVDVATMDSATGPDVVATDSGLHADAASSDGSIGGVRCSGAHPTFMAQVVPILSGCGGELCHGGLGTHAWPYSSLVNVEATRDTCGTNVLVVPNDPVNSYLVHKLTGVGMCPGTALMPMRGSPLPDSEIQTIVDWICAGARND